MRTLIIGIVIAINVVILAGVFFAGFKSGYVEGGSELCAAMRGEWTQTPRTNHYKCDVHG